MPNAIDPQTWNKYSYAINNPVLYNDPNGHCGPLCVAVLVVVGAFVLAGDTNPQLTNQPKEEMPFGDFLPDGKFTSLNISIAGKSRFWTGGIDVVNTKKQAGVFLTSAVTDPTSCNCSTLNKKTTFMIPNITITLNKGVLLGDDLKDDIKAYSGTASVISGGTGNWSGEAFSSTDNTGKRTNKVVGLGAGFGFGPCLLNLCGSSYYTNSKVAKLFGRELILKKFWKK